MEAERWTGVTNEFIPAILTMIQLKGTASSIVKGVPGQGQYRIGAEIPPVRYITVELEMLKMEYPAYVHQHVSNN